LTIAHIRAIIKLNFFEGGIRMKNLLGVTMIVLGTLGSLFCILKISTDRGYTYFFPLEPYEVFIYMILIASVLLLIFGITIILPFKKG